jgi:predicted ATPase
LNNRSSEKQIIFSTHSDFVLDRIKPEQVFSVTRTVRRGTTVRSLAVGYSKRRTDALREFLRTSGNLGEYWRQGGLED